MITAGIASLKIEGRMKSAYYIATLIKTYRMLIDEIYAEGGRLSDKRMEWYYNELAKAENRPTGCGFYEGMPSFHGHLYGVNGAGVTQEFIAYVLDYEEESGMATLEVRNNFADISLRRFLDRRYPPHVLSCRSSMIWMEISWTLPKHQCRKSEPMYPCVWKRTP